MKTKLITVIATTLWFSTTANAETLVFGVLAKSLSQPFWASMENGLKESSKSAQVDYYLQAVGKDQPAEQELNTCNLMLQRKPNVLLTAAVDTAALQPCLERALKLNIPVIDLNGNTESTAVAFSVASDQHAVGAQAAEYIAQQLGTHASGTVLVIETAANSPTDQNRTSSFFETLASNAPELEIVTTKAPDGNHADGIAITNQLMQKHTDLKAIFAANDSIALGATDATFAANGSDNIIVVGIDGSADAISSITDGKLDATVARFPYLIGKQAVTKASALLSGANIERSVNVPTLVVTKDIIEAGNNPLMQYIN